MVTSTGEPAPTFEPALTFPHWPFSCLALYSRVAQDFELCAQGMVQANDFKAVFEVEQLFSIKLFRDLLQGYIDLMLCPLNATTALMAEYCERSITQHERCAGVDNLAEPQSPSATGERGLRVINGREPD